MHAHQSLRNKWAKRLIHGHTNYPTTMLLQMITFTEVLFIKIMHEFKNRHILKLPCDIKLLQEDKCMYICHLETNGPSDTWTHKISHSAFTNDHFHCTFQWLKTSWMAWREVSVLSSLDQYSLDCYGHYPGGAYHLWRDYTVQCSYNITIHSIIIHH